MEQEWFNAKERVPEEDDTVLVYLECHQVTLGIFLNGKWHTVIPPWDSMFSESEVLCWSELPEPPTDMLNALRRRTSEILSNGTPSGRSN
jgi:hypothetical protein